VKVVIAKDTHINKISMFDLLKLYWDQPVQVVGYSQSDHLNIVLWNKSNKIISVIDGGRVTPIILNMRSRKVMMKYFQHFIIPP